MNYIKTTWTRVSRANPCPVCERPDWCLISGPPDSPTVAICARVESRKRVGENGAGWLHGLRDDNECRDRPRQRRVEIETPAEPTIDSGRMAMTFEACLDPARLARLALDLGVSVESLS